MGILETIFLLIIGASIGYSIAWVRGEDKADGAYQVGFLDGLNTLAEPGDVVTIPHRNHRRDRV